jgi:dihydrofolate reductase
MRKLIESTFVTLDGVLSDPQKWGPPYWDDEHHQHAHRLLFDADALVLGRETYEGFAQAWPSRAGADDYANRINELPKHVASTTLSDSDMSWNATLLEGDVAESVAELKAMPGQNLLKFGTGEFDRTLLEHKLVDEYHLWIFPVFVGSGQRIFDGMDTTHLRLVETTPFKSGIIVAVYAPK